MKTCIKCKEEYPATTEYYYKAKTNKDGLNNQCKECKRKQAKKYQERKKNDPEWVEKRRLEQRKRAEVNREKNKNRVFDENQLKHCGKCKKHKPATPEYFNRDNGKSDGLHALCRECSKSYDLGYYKENEDIIVQRALDWYAENKDRKSEYDKRYRLENIDKINQYREDNKERYREWAVTWRLENKEHRAEYSKRYRQENKDRVNLLNQRRQARISQLPHTLTLEEWEDALEYFDYSCAYCGISDERLHQEHIIPIVEGGGYTADNIIPACKSCNSSKHVRNMEEWYSEQEFFNIGRFISIHEYTKSTTPQEQQG